MPARSPRSSASPSDRRDAVEVEGGVGESRRRTDPTRRWTHREVSHRRSTTAERSANRHDPSARRGRRGGNLPADGRAAHRSPGPSPSRWTEQGAGTLADGSETRRPAGADRAARTPSVERRSGAKPEATARSTGRRTAGGEQAAAMRHGCRRGANLRRVERQRGIRTRPDELRLERPTRRKPGEPRPGTGCNTPGAVNGGSRRGGGKPRGRSTTRRSGIRRPKGILRNLREWTFTGTSGDGPTARDEVPGEAGSSCAARRERIRLGSAGTPKARPRWEATRHVIREDPCACPGIERPWSCRRRR